MCLNGRDMVYFWERVEAVIQVQTVLEFKPELDTQPAGRQYRVQVCLMSDEPRLSQLCWLRFGGP
ncbi:MAG: hypothetical protein EA415_00375 [Sphaerobacteraceae bacterium]|nr:MAG: hypothetical protein EA415_00375 [Sphaerobacteraceae bacterium]